MAADLHEPEGPSWDLGGARNALDDRMGIEYTEAKAGRVVARMPVDGNTQAHGTLHEGAICALAAAAGSCLAAIFAGPGRVAVAAELSATHHRPARSGFVTGTATMAHASQTLVTCDVVITDDQDRLLCTARVTSNLRDRPSRPDRLTAQAAPGRQSRVTAVTGWLRARGAADIPHPGGTLLAHLERVHALLAQWEARPAVRLAGLCHAYYGTDGFGTALGEPGGRDELARIAGAAAERLVYFYASCDRRISYPHLAEHRGPFRDRFTGTVLRPPLRLRRDFAELTAANELDIIRVNPDLRAQFGPDLLRLLSSWKELLSDSAWQSAQAGLQSPGGPRQGPDLLR